MSDKITVSGVVGTTNPQAELTVEVWMDQDAIAIIPHVIEDTVFSCDISDDDAKHCLKIVLKHKQPEHTTIDDQGNILEDARITVKDIVFGDSPLGQIFTDKAVYTHDFNGTKEPVQDKFYGELGCNGELVLNFETPFYIWMLESM